MPRHRALAAANRDFGPYEWAAFDGYCRTGQRQIGNASIDHRAIGQCTACLPVYFRPFVRAEIISAQAVSVRVISQSLGYAVAAILGRDWLQREAVIVVSDDVALAAANILNVYHQP